MYRIKFSIVFASALIWRLIILLALTTVLQSLVAKLFAAFTTPSFSNTLLLLAGLLVGYFIPFVIAIYWMLISGTMWKITKRYSVESPSLKYAQLKYVMTQKIKGMFWRSK